MTYRHNYYIFITTLLMLLCTAAVNAMDVKDFTFQHLGIQNGLSSQRVYSMYQTKDGAIWWTTKNGVDRSNGVSVRNYSLDPRNKYSSLAGRKIRFANSTKYSDNIIVFDNTGRIFHYNKIQDRFDLTANIADKKKGDIVLSSVLAADDGLWLAMRDGIYKLDNNGNLLVVRKNLDGNYIQQVGDNIMLCSRQGVFAYNNTNKGISRWLDANVITIYYDQQMGKVWFGTFDQGVMVMDMKTHGITTLQVPHNPVRAIRPYGKDNMLLGIDGYGVYQASRTRLGAAELFSANEGREGTLHGNGVYDILVDSWNDIVIGTYSGGIDIARPVGSTTAIFRHVKNSQQSIVNDHVNCVGQIGDNLLMGTDNGVSIFNSKTSQWRHTAQGMVVLDICKKPDGSMLMATYGNGVCDMATGAKVYSVANGTLIDDHVYRLRYDKAGNLWIGTLMGNLAVKTPDGMKYFNIDNIMSMFPMADGRMAVGTAHGLYLIGINDKTPKEQRYQNGGDPNRYVFDVYETPDHRLWVATDGGGVYIYNEKTHATQQITTEQGLPSNCVTSITADAIGRLWFGTEKGLAFVESRNPQKVENVNYCYGLNTEYCQHAVANLANGDVIYGTVDGAIIISPKMIGQLNYKAVLNIKGVTLHSEESSLDDFNEQIARELSEGTIHLDYDQRSFDLSFESINLRNQFDIAYQYKMGDGSWVTVDGKQQSVSFENLEPGTHDLTIRSISKTSGRVLDEKTITIVIAQPWWNSWWMWCIYVLLIAFAFYGAWWMYGLHSKYMRLMMDRVSDVSELYPDDQTPKQPNDQTANQPNDQTTNQPNDKTGEEFIGKATKIVMDNLKNEDFTIDDFSREIGMSRTLFYVKLKTYTGRSPLEFIRAIRMERAAALLRQGRTVTDVSALTGFDNPKYFSTVFKKYFGVSPSKYE